MKNDHRSKFSNLSNWKEEAWKNQGFNGIRTRDPWPQASSFQLLKLENLLRWSFFTLIYNRSSNIWIISYVLHINFNHLVLITCYSVLRRRDMRLHILSRICVVGKSKIEKGKKTLFIVNSYSTSRLTFGLWVLLQCQPFQRSSK